MTVGDEVPVKASIFGAALRRSQDVRKAMASTSTTMAELNQWEMSPRFWRLVDESLPAGVDGLAVLAEMWSLSPQALPASTSMVIDNNATLSLISDLNTCRPH